MPETSWQKYRDWKKRVKVATNAVHKGRIFGVRAQTTADKLADEMEDLFNEVAGALIINSGDETTTPDLSDHEEELVEVIERGRSAMRIGDIPLLSNVFKDMCHAEEHNRLPD